MKAGTGSNFFPMLAVIGSILSLTVGTSFGKQLFPLLGPGGTALSRVLLAALLLQLIWRPWQEKLSRQDKFKLLQFGLILGLMNFFFYQTIARLPLGISIAIEFTGPLTVAVMLSRRLIDFVWVGVTALGLWLLLPMGFTHGGESSASGLDPLGLVFAFVSALLWGLYIVFGKRITHLHGGRSTTWGMTVAALTIAPLAIAESGAKLVQPQLFLPALGLAIASSAIPYSLEMYALKKLPKHTFGILLSLEPAVGALSGLFILHEVLTFNQWLGIACVMSASIGTTFAAKQDRAPLDAVAPDAL